MYLSEITVRDLGVDLFQNARMDGIDDEVVVIGGPQRAGKTTCLEAIRRLGYGIERNPDLPPAVEEYSLQATVEHDGHRYALKLDGHSDPSLIGTGGAPPLDLDVLYGGVSKTQYQQLFTITLDELERIPDSIDTPEDLAEVLLGAAYGDVALIPDVEQTVAERADDIGRSYGKPTKNSELNGPIRTIEDGIERRDAANRQVDEWGERRETLAETTDEIAELETEVSVLEAEAERLAVLDAEYSNLAEFRQHREELEAADLEAAETLPEDAVGRADRLLEAYRGRLEKFEKQRDTLQGNAPDGAGDAYKTALLEHRSDLNRFDRQIPKWETQVEDITEETARLNERRDELQRRVSEIRAAWEGRFDEVLAVRTDSLADGDISAAVESFRNADSDLEAARKEKQQTETRKAELEAKLDEEPDGTEESGIDRLLLGGAVAVGLGALALGVGGGIAGAPILGGLAGVVALLVGLYVVISRTDTRENSVSTARELQGQLQTAEANIKTAEANIRDARERRDDAAETLDAVAETLGLPDDVPPESVGTFYSEVAACKADIQELQDEHAQLEDTRDDLVAELTAASTNVSEIRPHHWKETAPIETAEHLIEAIETAADDLELAEDLRESERSLERLEDDIESLINDWPAVDDIDTEGHSKRTVAVQLEEFQAAAEQAADTMETKGDVEDQRERIEHKLQTGSTEAAFEEIKPSDESWLDVFEDLAADYPDAASVTQAHAAVEEHLEELNVDLEEAKEKRIELRKELDELKSDDDIVEARERISEGREELRTLGEEYAVNRIAEHLTGRLHRRFIEEVAGPLIDDASEIFRSITREYEGITHNEQFDALDFDAIRDGKPARSSDELSRATAEQLFLSVRLARIRQLDVSLPVVIDDSLTNFDPAHGSRTFRTIAELATTNQVLFLTCHPEHVALAETYGNATQFWGLDDGRFTGPFESSDTLYDLLETESGHSLELT
jgi:uncharacterized protein YhaN